MLLLNFDLIDADVLAKLCAEACPESDTLDFKRDIPGQLDKDKHELQKDVCAFANADGGDLIYGIDESAGCASAIAPISVEQAEVAKRRILQVLDAGIEPRVPGLQIRHVDVSSGYVLIIRVPASFDGPHCIRSNHNRRFVMRNGTTTSDLTYQQLRSAFDRTASLTERASQFIQERRRRIANSQTPKRLIAGPQFVAHVVPIAGLANRQSMDLQRMHETGFTSLVDEDWGGSSRDFNLDGLVVYPGAGDDGTHYGYRHVFRTGALESVSLGGAKTSLRQGGPAVPIVWSLDMSKYFHRTIATFLSAAKDLNLAGPAVLGVAVLNVEGYELALGEVFRRFRAAIADRPHLELPDCWIPSIQEVDLDSLVRPLLDTLWQAFGAARCLDIDPGSGKFNPRRR